MTSVMRFTSVLAVVLLLGACSSSKKGDGSASGGAQQVPITGLEHPQGMDTAPLQVENGPQPGTQQDLVVNVGDRVFFDYDKYDLRPDARATVERQAQWLRTYPGVQITVQGHSDERGTREYNLALGERRATAVRNYLIALGIDAGRVDTISYGKERPAVLGSNEDSWGQNRRGVLVVR